MIKTTDLWDQFSDQQRLQPNQIDSSY